MAVGMAALATFLFYLGAVPVKFAVLMRATSGASFSAGISIFEGRFAVKAAVRHAASHASKSGKFNFQLFIKLLPELTRAALYLLRRLHLDALSVQGRICLKNAAHTALTCGCAKLLQGALLPVVPAGSLHLDLQPDFSAGQSDVTAQCIISLRAGQIMFAALSGVWHYAYRRISHGKASH